MSSAVAFGGTIGTKLPYSRLTPFQFSKLKLSSQFLVSQNPNCYGNIFSAHLRQRIQFRNEPPFIRCSCLSPVKVSSNDAQVNKLPEENEFHRPNFIEFITSERVKVVAMLALALALCNADRVVMSVAIVPLSLSNGWSRSFAGIVQVGLAALWVLRISAYVEFRTQFFVFFFLGITVYLLVDAYGSHLFCGGIWFPL